jgi:hypothetical protein
MNDLRAFNRRDVIKVSATTGAGLIISMVLSSCQEETIIEWSPTCI